MKKKVHEQVWPTLLVTAIGFGLLAAALPEWARAEVALFGVIFAGLVVTLDEDIRHALRSFLGSCLRRSDSAIKSKPAKAPASRRAAT
jgi:hypothetical protein